ncbi:MAG: hypothetical protein IJ193_06310 [Bacilli bacterium]|nr:hypothetical protein [Bacilli bacterium]
MNVLVLNEQQNQLQNIEVDIIKSITGSFQTSEIVGMFKDFFFNKMILDVTALTDYQNPEIYKELSEGLNPDKVILFLPEGSDLCTSGFLSRLINYGLYNFTTNLDGVVYLINNTNTYKDVEHIKKMAEAEINPSEDAPVENKTEYEVVNQNQTNTTSNKMPEPTDNQSIPDTYYDMVQKKLVERPKEQIRKKEEPVPNNNRVIIGFQNVTDHAGSTSLIYMIKKELDSIYGKGIYAIELEKSDFLSYNDKSMISDTKTEVSKTIQKLVDAKVILIDLNGQEINGLCEDIVYLIEPSIIRLNTLMRRNKLIIAALRGKKTILNKSLLNQKEVSEFEYESGLRIIYNMPPLNDRKRNEIISDFLRRINVLEPNNTENQQTGIFGLFRK